MSDKIKYEDEFLNLSITADTIIDDVYYDKDGNVVIDKNNDVIVLPNDSAYTSSFTVSDLDEFVTEVQKAIDNMESGD